MGYVEQAALVLSNYPHIRDHSALSLEAKAGYMAAVAMVDPTSRLGHLTVEHAYSLFKQVMSEPAGGSTPPRT